MQVKNSQHFYSFAPWQHSLSLWKERIKGNRPRA